MSLVKVDFGEESLEGQLRVSLLQLTLYNARFMVICLKLNIWKKNVRARKCVYVHACMLSYKPREMLLMKEDCWRSSCMDYAGVI